MSNMCAQIFVLQHRLERFLFMCISVLVMSPLAVHSDAGGGGQSSLRVIEGDVLVADNPLSRAITVPATNPPWVNGIVPYRIDSTLPLSSIQAINRAILRWNQLSGITLVALDADNENSALLASTDDALIFQPGPGCASWVGRRGGVQEVWVAPNCTAGSVLHEIGHALGLEHEHTRPDRDQYITINWNNIDPAKRHNFNVAPAGSRPLGQYDYDSIMHYGPKNFSINQQATITPRFVATNVIGQRRSPSQGDLAAIASLYATDLSVLTQVYPFNQTSEVAIHVSNDRAQGAHSISLNVSIGEGRLREYNEDQWNCNSAAAGKIDCTLEQLAGGTTSLLLLNLDRNVALDQVRAVVSSKTPDDNLKNNANSADDEPTLSSAIAAVQDDTTDDGSFGAGLSPAWLVLALLWLYRKTGFRIYRHVKV